MTDIMNYGDDDIARFWSKVNKTDGCWEWAGKPNEKGYGRFGVNYRVIFAHRFSWLITHGEIPDGLFVLHRCDNPICVRPDDLFLGTKADNNADMRAKGRAAPMPRTPNAGRFQSNGRMSGEHHHLAKLTAEDVLYIRQLRANGVRLRVLAQHFGVSEANISQIAKRKVWKNI